MRPGGRGFHNAYQPTVVRPADQIQSAPALKRRNEPAESTADSSRLDYSLLECIDPLPHALEPSMRRP
jgi:hypothetical protein